MTMKWVRFWHFRKKILLLFQPIGESTLRNSQTVARHPAIKIKHQTGFAFQRKKKETSHRNKNCRLRSARKKTSIWTGVKVTWKFHERIFFVWWINALRITFAALVYSNFIFQLPSFWIFHCQIKNILLSFSITRLAAAQNLENAPRKKKNRVEISLSALCCVYSFFAIKVYFFHSKTIRHHHKEVVERAKTLCVSEERERASTLNF